VIIESNFLSQILIEIINFMLSGFDRVIGPLWSLFTILMEIDLLLFFAFIAFRRVEIGEILSRLFTITFYLSLLLIYPQVAVFFMRLFIGLALIGGGDVLTEAQLLNPASFFAQGLRLAAPIFMAGVSFTAILSPLSTMINFILGLALLAGFAVIAIMVSWAIVEFYFRLFMSSLLLPFSASAITRGWAAEAIGALVSSALRLGGYAFIVSAFVGILSNIALPEDPNLTQIVTAIVGVFFMAYVVVVSPSLVASTISGAPVSSGIGIASTAVAVGSTAAAIGTGGITAGVAAATAFKTGGAAGVAKLPIAAASSSRAASATRAMFNSAVSRGKGIGSGKRLPYRSGQSPNFINRWKSEFGGRGSYHRGNLDLDLDND
jgi:type IV secretory pathway TrbL component